MSKAVVFEKVKELGLLAVIRGPSPDLTIKMVAALVDGGVSGIEITYSTPNADRRGSRAAASPPGNGNVRKWPIRSK